MTRGRHNSSASHLTKHIEVHRSSRGQTTTRRCDAGISYSKDRLNTMAHEENIALMGHHGWPPKGEHHVKMVVINRWKGWRMERWSDERDMYRMMMTYEEGAPKPTKEGVPKPTRIGEEEGPCKDSQGRQMNELNELNELSEETNNPYTSTR